MVTQLALLHGNVQRVETKQDDLSNFLLDKALSSTKESHADFKKKYNVSLPISDKDVFVIFDESLKTNKFLKNDVCLELGTQVDQVNCSITKTYLAMLRKFVTKEVMMQYTASRISKDKVNPKDIFKSTEFYHCMEGKI